MTFEKRCRRNGFWRIPLHDSARSPGETRLRRAPQAGAFLHVPPQGEPRCHARTCAEALLDGFCDGSATDCSAIYANRARDRALRFKTTWRDPVIFHGKIQTSRIEEEENRLQARPAALLIIIALGFGLIFWLFYLVLRSGS